MNLIDCSEYICEATNQVCPMREIYGDDRTIQQLLSGRSYNIDYYQREYLWKPEHLQELISDLIRCFLRSYHTGDALNKVATYEYYFLGSIVISNDQGNRHIVDGQQRLTSLLLLLIYLNNLQKGNREKIIIETLIYDDDYGKKLFKLNVPERNDCMEALFNGTEFNTDNASDSVRNLVARYQQLDELFNKELPKEALPFFIYWLRDRVKLIEIVANADEDAYTIFETMNDRGLSLTPTEMLKGYLLAMIKNPTNRSEANKLITGFLVKFAKYGRKTDSEFFKAWLRSQYAAKIRERKKDAKSEDFDLIGTEYHRWVRNHADQIGLVDEGDFYQFIVRDFKYFASLYLRLLDAAKTRTKGMESVRYNADTGFTLQHHVILAAVTPDDDDNSTTAKVSLVADFLDIMLNRRLWNFRSITYSTMEYATFLLIQIIRGKSLPEIQKVLHEHLTNTSVDLNFSKPVHLNRSTSNAIHRQLARFTDWLEQKSGEPGHYENYIIRSGTKSYEVEHIWADKYERFTSEFKQKDDFDLIRNQIGGLLLLPKKVNASLNAMTYEEKLPHYLKQNALAKSLNEGAYQNNPGFRDAIKKYNLNFRAHQEFTKADLEERSKLYCLLAELIWSPNRLLDKKSGDYSP